jgi:hypothetical protein
MADWPHYFITMAKKDNMAEVLGRAKLLMSQLGTKD